MVKIFTNGVFDILHAGHINVLLQAKMIGGKVIVGLNSDKSVKALKGESRPIFSENERKILLLSLMYVDEVIIFDEPSAVHLIEAIKPDIYIKGWDYTDKELPEYNAVREYGGKIVLAERCLRYGETHTSDIIQRIKLAE